MGRFKCPYVLVQTCPLMMRLLCLFVGLFILLAIGTCSNESNDQLTTTSNVEQNCETVPITLQDSVGNIDVQGRRGCQQRDHMAR